MTRTLILLRHGQSEWNQLNLFTGWVDVRLTEQGKTEAEQASERQAPWEQASEGFEASSHGQLFKALGGLAHAAKAVAQTGDESLSKQAADLVDETRKKLYGLLAEN